MKLERKIDSKLIIFILPHYLEFKIAFYEIFLTVLTGFLGLLVYSFFHCLKFQVITRIV